MADEPQPNNVDSVAEALGRGAGRLLKTARPRIKDAARAARPHIESAIQYAREHEDEIKDVATGLVKSRIPVSLRGAVDAVSGKVTPSPPKPLSVICAGCGQPNPPSAKFCNECGAALSPR
jgi:hypothetical protein